MEVALIQLLVSLLEGVGWVMGKVWRAYARILNLPILVGAVLDGIAGVFFGAGMLGSASTGTFSWGCCWRPAAGSSRAPPW